MADETELDARARKLIALRAAHGKAEVPAAPATLDEAYQVQFALERALLADSGWRAIGWKIGATNAGSRAALKLERPFLGRLYAQMSSGTPAQLPAHDGYRAYEAEIALLLGRDLDARSGPVDAAAVKAATAAVAPAIEVVGGWAPTAGPLHLIGDFAGSVHWAVGPETRDFAALDLMEASVAFSLDGEPKATGKGAAVDDGPYGATAWLANELGRLGCVLKAGEYITTGTTIAPVPYAGPGKKAVADFGPLGKVEVTIG